MRELVSSIQMKNYDAYTINQMHMPSCVLMERAALAVVEELVNDSYPTKHILIICGSGNNGGDGIAIARILHLRKFKVSVFLSGNIEHMTPETLQQRKIAQNFGVSFVQDFKFAEYTTIVDAIFGIGLTRSIEGPYQILIESMNESGLPIVSVDIPSGIDGTTGQIMGCAVKATTTITFAYEKIGHYLYPGRAYCGKLILKDIGIVSDTCGTNSFFYRMSEEDIANIPKRKSYGNKGTFKKILLIAGSSQIGGACYLSALAAFRMGVGMVKIFTHANNKLALAQMLPEAMIETYDESDLNLEQLDKAVQWADLLGIGPGLGMSDRAVAIFTHIMRYTTKPLVLDADALNILSEDLELLEHHCGRCVLTPHLGEMTRLLNCSMLELSSHIVEYAKDFAKKYNVTLVLKDAVTITSIGGENTYLNASGNHGMATAGSGDVLTGMILGMMAKNIEDVDMVPLAVYVHGLAGDVALRSLGASYMMATDLIHAIPYILE